MPRQELTGGHHAAALRLDPGQVEHVSLTSGLALVYLIVAGSLVGYTAYVWLLSNQQGPGNLVKAVFVGGAPRVTVVPLSP